jgi:hypothetical protein
MSAINRLSRWFASRIDARWVVRQSFLVHSSALAGEAPELLRAGSVL